MERLSVTESTRVAGAIQKLTVTEMRALVRRVKRAQQKAARLATRLALAAKS